MAQEVKEEPLHIKSSFAAQTYSQPTNKQAQLWGVIKTTSNIIFDSVAIGNCIYKTFAENNWVHTTDILDNLIQFEQNNIIHIIANNIKKENKVRYTWDEERDNKILYQLLLAIYKDNKLNIASILNEFIAISALYTETTDFSNCTEKQMIDLLIHHSFKQLAADDVNAMRQNMIIEYFVDNKINGDRFNTLKQNDFIKGLQTFINDKYKEKLSENALVKLHGIMTSYKDNKIWQCEVCYHTNNVMPNELSKAICSGCYASSPSTESIELKTTDDDQYKIRANSPCNELGDVVLEFFNKRSGKEYDDKVFVALAKLVGNDENGLIRMRYDNYSVDLDKKDYNTILKSFIGWIAAVKCEDNGCANKAKLICCCDVNTFQSFTYSVILSIIGLKSANNDSLLQQLSLQNRTINKMRDKFTHILPDKLKPEKSEKKQNKENYLNKYRKYIAEWISFELYNFKCVQCGHINKSILIDRMFQYTINLRHCRLCHHKRGSNVADFGDLEVAVTKLTPNVSINQYQVTKSDETFYEKYECGLPIRYTVLKPKYCSLAEEILSNDVISISKQLFYKYLEEAKSLHAHLRNNKKRKTLVDPEEYNKDFGIAPNGLIGISHLMVILIFTQNIQFARKFSEAYWHWKDIKLFCNNFYWFGRYLFESVHFYGERFDHNRFKIKPLRHSLATPMEFDAFAPTIHFPASTNDTIRVNNQNGFILSYVPKYIGNIDNTKCVSTSQWSGYNNNEWLFMGASKLQIYSIKVGKQEFTMYNYAILYLEKIFTQTIYDITYYNTLNNTLYLPETRQLALKLILDRIGIELFPELPQYISIIFGRWCIHKRLISLETYSSESQFMSKAMRQFLTKSVVIDDDQSDVVNFANLLRLFPKLQKYYDIDGKLVFVNRDSCSTLSISPKSSDSTEDIPIRMQLDTDRSDVKSWKCQECGYKNIKLMVAGLWREYNKLNVCVVCCNHRFIKDHALSISASSKSPNSAAMKDEFELKLQILATNQETTNGFDKNVQCLVDKCQIFQLSTEQLAYLLDKHIFNEIKQPLITKYKNEIISYFKQDNISGEKFIGLKKKELKKNLAAYCNHRKLPGPLGKLFKQINEFDLRKLNNGNTQQTTTYKQLSLQCPAMKRANFIVHYFEQLTSKLTRNRKYPFDMRRFLVSLPEYGPVKLLNDIEHIVGHKPTDSLQCEQKTSTDCIHFKRSRRDESERFSKDINTKRKLFNCDNANDFIYIDMLDRLHTLLKHSQDINHNPDRHIKLIKEDVKSTKVRFSIGVYMEYFSLTPLYQNLFQEVTQNDSYSIGIHQFKSQLDAVKEFMQTNNEILRRSACKTDEKYGISKGDLICVQHILCIMLYCNCSNLCTEFRKSYRKTDYEDTADIIMARHAENFYWLGRFLTNAIEFYGKPAKKRDIIYTGISCKCLFDSFSAVYEMPTSTTWDVDIANRFTKETGLYLRLSPKYKNQVHVSRYIDVSKISNFPEEKERLFAGMTIMAITNITNVVHGKLIEYDEWVYAILYLERIVEQTIHTKEQYNYGVITETQTAEKWMDRQKNYLVPLMKHQMTRNLAQYKEYLEDEICFDNQTQLDIPKYVCELFEHFCDNKARTFIDLSCIMSESKRMDPSLFQILFKNKECEINVVRIVALFPNIKQFKNKRNQWISLPSLKVIFDEIKTKNIEDEMKENAKQNTVKGVIEQIDKGLGVYYAVMGRDNYFNAKGIGKFQFYCDENGFDNDNIDEELVNAQESMLVEMDDSFPLDFPMGDAQRNEFIFDIIIQCKNKRRRLKFFKKSEKDRWAPTHSFFEVSDAFIAETENKYKKQCNSIWKQGINVNSSLMKVIAIGQKNNLPYLQYLVDLYMREKIAYQSKLNQTLTISQWSLDNYYMKQVQKLDKEKNTKYHAMIFDSVKSFGSRIAPQMNLKPDQVINDSLFNIATRIWDICGITDLAQFRYTGSLIVPFQMDFSIICRKTEPETHTDDDDEDIDDEWDEYDEYDEYESKINNERIPIVGDISSALKGNKLLYVAQTVEDDSYRDDESTRSSTARLMRSAFEDLHKEVAKNNVNSGYPHRSRFCGILDRRLEKVGKNDKLYMFDAPSDCNKMDNNHVPECYFEASKKCLIPTVGKEHITSTTMPSQMLCFSFHVEATDTIKCYLFYNGGMMRFFAEDVVDVLPWFFVTNETNQKFLDEKRKKNRINVINGINRQLRDPQFESFLQYASRL